MREVVCFMQSDLSDIDLYLTAPHTCSYLAEQLASTIFVDPKAHITKEQYTYLMNNGFRRSGYYIYRPRCDNCQACIPARVIVDQFKMNRSQKRVIKQNKNIVVSKVTSIDSEEHFNLYQNYISERHLDGDMYPATMEQYKSFLVDAPIYCSFYEFREEGRLIAVSVVDVLEDNLSAVYTFFDPYEPKRALGRYAILWQIQEAKRLGLSYLSLGYWIKACRKMSYKLEYRPLELLINQQWVLLT